MLKVISFLLIVLFNFSLLSTDENFSFAFITNQESDSVDVIDLISQKKISEIKVGHRPAGITLDKINNHFYVSNPESANVSRINLKDLTESKIETGESPVGIYFSESDDMLAVSNWYDNKITLIDTKTKKIKKTINVGKSPAGIYISQKTKDIFVANREDNNIYVINGENFKLRKKIKVGLAPFGIYSNSFIDFIVITNVQSNSISIIDKKILKVVGTIEVEKWPYQAVYDFTKNYLYVTNQRSNSISVIDMEEFKNIKTVNDVCEYPEGIDISYNQNLIVIACWFEDNVILLDLTSLKLVNKIETSGGPRAFGKFIVEK